MPSAERRSPPSVRELLREATGRLRAVRLAYGHGTANARDEAAWIVLRALGLPPDAAGDALERPVAPARERRARALIERRARERVPAAYLLREAWLGEFRFYIDRRAIVPRSYVAELLHEDLAPWVARPRRVRAALDLCTGSGCLAVLLAHSFPRARIDAADLSRAALAVARRNVSAYRLARRIRLVESDLFSALRGRRYDLIVSNPPYVREAVMRRLPAEYRREPRLALAGGSDGLDLVRRILDEAAERLNPGGLLVVETGHARARLERAFPRLAFVWPQTSGGNDCVFVLTREALLQARAPAAPRAAASPRRQAARTPARA